MRRVDWFFVVVLLLFAAGLRFLGLSFGQPDPQYAPSNAALDITHENIAVHPDEYLFVQRPLRMLLTGERNPKFFHNPSLMIGVNYVTFWLTGEGRRLTWAGRAEIDARREAPFRLYVLARTYSVLGGLLAVAATYAAARLMSGRFGALCAGLVTAVSLPLVQHAHYTTTSSLAAGFAAVCVWASLASLRKPRWWLFALAGFAAGLAAGSRYNAAAVSIVVFVVGLALLYRQRDLRTLVMVGMGYVLFPLTFLFTTPYVIFDTAFFLEEFRGITGEYIGGVDVDFAVSRWRGLFIELRYLVEFGLGIPAAVVAIVGVWSAYRRRGRSTLDVSILLVYLLPYAYVVLRTARPQLSDQMLVPILPALALLVGVGAGWLYENARPPSAVVAPGLAVLLVVIPLWQTLPVVRLLTVPDSRYRMQAWVHEHIPPGAVIYLKGPYNVPLDEAVYTWTQDFDIALDVNDIPPDADYVIRSHANAREVLRGTASDEFKEDYQRELRVYHGAFETLAWVAYPSLPGEDNMVHTASYWHQPGLTVYCTTAESCAAVR